MFSSLEPAATNGQSKSPWNGDFKMKGTAYHLCSSIHIFIQQTILYIKSLRFSILHPFLILPTLLLKNSEIEYGTLLNIHIKPDLSIKTTYLAWWMRNAQGQWRGIPVSNTREWVGSHCICYDSAIIAVTFYVIVFCHLLFPVCIYALWYDFRCGHFFFCCYVYGLLCYSLLFYMTQVVT